VDLGRDGKKELNEEDQGKERQTGLQHCLLSGVKDFLIRESSELRAVGLLSGSLIRVVQGN
jgi:hypothetical protein